MSPVKKTREYGADRFLVVAVARRKTFGLDQPLNDFDFITKKLKLPEASASTLAMLCNSDRVWYGRCSQFHANDYKAIRILVA
jgi:hypothetical protein